MLFNLVLPAAMMSNILSTDFFSASVNTIPNCSMSTSRIFFFVAMTLWLHIASMSTIVSASTLERGKDEISEPASRSELSMKSGSSSQLNAVVIIDVSLFFIHQ